ncbi:uncharacterized protein LOC134684747 [Mytilus trossulus]|uniref:uncharacterized protein LOC134684747 n=1 Tax=Mytilus trossulus TaxID=6551 RepID=UPI003004F6A7
MATPSNIRCARCSMVVLDVCNAIMQDLMQHQPISAPDLYKMIMKDRYFLTKKINSIEIHTIQTLITDGFSKLDFSIIYKIAKYFRGLIPTPTRNWGTNPLPNEIEEGDDVERLRRKRNYMVHKVDAEISEQVMNEFFTTSIEIGRRIDNYLNKTGEDGHEEKIKHYQSCSLEPETTENYLRALREIECLKEKLTLKVGNKELHFYEGNSIAHVVAKLNESQSLNEGDHMTPVKLILHDVKDEDQQIELLNKLRTENNFDTDNIRFISATKECIAVFVYIRTTILVNSTIRSSEIKLFVQKMISSTGMMFYVEEDLNIVVVSSEDEINECPSNEIAEDVREQSDISLVLNLEMGKRVMQSNESVKENFERFLGNIYERTNGSVFSHREDTPFNVVLAENDNVRYIQEGLLEPMELLLCPRTGLDRCLPLKGGYIAWAGGIAKGGSVATHAVLSRKRRTSVEEISKRYNEKMNKWKEECLTIGIMLQNKVNQPNRHSSLAEEFPHWFNFWAKLIIGSSQVNKSTEWESIAQIILISLRIDTAFDDPDIGRCAVSGILLIPLDLNNIVDSVIDVHKKNPHRISSSIRAIGKKIKEKCPTETEIETMIRETINRL